LANQPTLDQDEHNTLLAYANQAEDRLARIGPEDSLSQVEGTPYVGRRIYDHRTWERSGSQNGSKEMRVKM